MSEKRKNRGWSAESYGERHAFENDWRDGWWNADFLDLMAERWALADVRDVLDVGCGVGHWGQLLAPRCHADVRLSGVDHEGGFRERAEARARERGLRFTFHEASGARLPFDDASFDLVTCQTVLMHVPDPAAVLGEMHRVARPGGLVVASEPNNLGNVLVEALAEPRPDFEETLVLLRFHEALHRGKIALGQGDSSIGERLPGLFAREGFADVQVVANDRCPALVPPYDAPDQQRDLAQTLKWMEGQVSGWGAKEDVRALHRAAGEPDAAFERAWALLAARNARFREAVEAGTYVGARGMTHYLVSGRRP
ncbi:MAG: methyltransferase domain-containing protein [Myxococcota bacterium]